LNILEISFQLLIPKQRLMVGCGPQWTYRRMLYSGLLLLQLRISGPCLCLEESMEEQDEKPQGSLKVCVQVSGASLLLGDQSLLPLCLTV